MLRRRKKRDEFRGEKQPADQSTGPEESMRTGFRLAKPRRRKRAVQSSEHVPISKPRRMDDTRQSQ
ncbi:hypothetical protein Mapa_004484 [Marchantia paleacea]|nr:hypothetical protein Mapa_004484 [Marchantia paleacea]